MYTFQLRVHTHPSTLGGRGRRISEFEDSLVYRVSSRTARAIQRNPVLKKSNQGAGEMAQQLTLSEVLSSIPSNHMVAYNHL